MSPSSRTPSGLSFAVITTISLAENTMYQSAPSLPDAPIGFPRRSSSITAGDDGAKT